MTSRTFPRLRRLCAALPKTKFDERFESLSLLQQLLVFAVTGIVVLAVPPLLLDAEGPRLSFAVALAVGTFYGLADLFARFNRR